MSQKGQEVKRITKSDLKKIRQYLLEKQNIHLLAFINVGINTALKITELSKMRLEDIKSDWSIDILSSRNQKKQTIKFNQLCIDSIKQLKEFYKEKGFSPDEGYLFKSLSFHNINQKIDKPITTNGVSRQFVKLREVLDIPYPIGTQSLSKTWGYYVYRETKDIHLIMRVLNKNTTEEALKYIGYYEEEELLDFKDFEI